MKFQELSGARLSFLNRHGKPILPEAKTVLQQDDIVFASVRLDDLAGVRALVAAPLAHAD